jgi:hypothetical protein
MDREEIRDGIMYFLVSDENRSPERTGNSLGEIKNFLEINHVHNFDYDDEELKSFLKEMENEGLIEEQNSDDEAVEYSWDNEGRERISGMNEELSMKWIMPPVEEASEDVEVEIEEGEDDFTLESDEKQDFNETRKEIIYEDD